MRDMIWGRELWRAVELVALTEQLKARFARNVTAWWARQWYSKEVRDDPR